MRPKLGWKDHLILALYIAAVSAPVAFVVYMVFFKVYIDSL